MLEKLFVFVEEPSMEAALEILLPKMLGEVEFEIRRFQCKNDLLKHLPDRLRAYRSWLPFNWAILVLVDRDDDDCTTLKQRLEVMASESSRVLRRLQTLREWSHEQSKQVFPGSARTGCAPIAGTS